MPEALARVNSYLPTYRQKRTARCGAPLGDLLWSNGERTTGHRYHCTDRFCPSCDLARRQRVYASVEQKFKNSLLIPTGETGFLVTLTCEKLPGLTLDNFSAATERLRALQTQTHRLLSRHAYAVARYWHHCQKPNLQKRASWWSVARNCIPRRDLAACYENPDDYHPLYTRRFGYQPSKGGRFSYVWAREITHGAAPHGWHVHAHYLVANECEAQKLIAAWIESGRLLGIKISPRGQRISIPKRATYDTGDAEHEQTRSAARYITQYITKNGVDDLPNSALETYIMGIHGLRQYDAGGEWRPLGIGKRRDDDAPRALAVILPYIEISSDGEVVNKEKEIEFQQFMRQSGAYWSEEIGFFLNKYRTNPAKSSTLVQDYISAALDAADRAKSLTTWGQYWQIIDDY